MLNNLWLTLLNTAAFSAYLARNVSALDAALQQNPSVVGVDSTVVSVSLLPELQVPAGGGFRITLPTAFKAGDLGCKVVEPQSIDVLSCTLESTKEVQMTIDGILPPFASVYLEVNGAASPSSTALNKDYTVSSFNASGITLETRGNLSLVQFQPAPLTEFAFVPERSDFGAKTSVDITITAGVEIPCTSNRSGCYLTVETPVLNAYSASRDRDLVFDEELLRCEAISEGQIATEIACMIIDDQYLEIAELNDGPVTVGSSFTVRVHGFNNPLFPKPIEGFQISTVDELGGLIEQTTQFTVSASTPAPITEVSLRLAPNSETSSNAVLEKSELLLDFAMPVPLETGCLIYIQIPADFTRLYQEMTDVQVYGMFGFIRSLPFAVQANNMVEIRDACTSYTENQLWAKVRIRSVVNPSSVRETSQFVIKVQNSSRKVIAQTQSSEAENLTIDSSAFSPGTMQEFRLMPSNPIVQETSSLQLSFQSTNSLSSEAIIVVNFPSSMLLASSCRAQPLDTVSIQTSMVCLSQPDNNRILLKQLFYNFGYNPLADGALSINFEDLVEKNPTSANPELTFTIQTFDRFDGAFSTVDAMELLVSDFTIAGSLEELSLTFDKSESNHFPATASIDFIVTHETLLDDSALRISFPEDFRFAQSQIKVTAQRSFKSQAPSFTFSDANTIIVEDLSQLEAGDRVSFTVSSIQLPRYQGLIDEPVSIAIIVASTGNSIDRAELQYFVDDATRWDSANLYLSSSHNLANTELQLDFAKTQTGLFIDPYDALVLSLPRDVLVDKRTLKCRLDDIQHTCLYAEEANSLTVTQLVAQATEMGTLGTLQLSVDGLQNPKSTRPLSNFSFSLKDSKSRVIVTGDSLTWQTTEPSELQLKLVQDSTAPQAVTSYRFSPIAPQTDLQSSHVIVRFPDCMEFDKDVLKVEDSKSQSLQFSLADDQKSVKIQHTRQTLAAIVLQGITNPSEKCLLSAGSGIKVETYDDSAYEYVQAIVTLQPSLGCIDSCLGCLATDTTVCTSCSVDQFLTEDGRCVRECPDGTISDTSLGTCALCASECSTCRDSPDFCLVCSDPFKVASQQGTCIEEASCKRDGFYVSQEDQGAATLCLECSADCLACEGTAETCTACPSGLFLYDGSCFEACGDGLTGVSIESMGNVCEESALLEVLASLQVDLKSSFALLVTCILIAIVKLSCKREMGLLVSFVTISANFEAIALLLTAYRVYETRNETEDMPEGDEERLLFMIGPFCLLALLLVFNICVTVRFFKALCTPFEGEEDGEAEISRDKWKAKAFSCSRITCMVTSLVLSFHNTAWLNISGQLPLSMKRRLYMHRFTEDYARISKLTISLPKLAIQAFGVYFGVFAREIRSRETQMCLLDLTLVSLTQTFILLLALNFQWTMTTMDNTTVADSPSDQSKATQGVIQTRNSLELHNLRLSQLDLTELALAAVSKKQNSAIVQDATGLKLLFQAESHEAMKRRSLLRQQRDPAGRSHEDEDSPHLGPPEKQLRSRNQLSLSVFKRVQQSLKHRVKFNNYSAGSNRTPAPRDTEKVIQMRPVRRPSIDVLSEAYLAVTHDQIDKTFNLTELDLESDATVQRPTTFDSKGDVIGPRPPEAVGPIRDFSFAGSAEEATTFDATAYTSNDKLTSVASKSPLGVGKRKSRHSSVLMTSTFSAKLNSKLQKQDAKKSRE